MSLKKILFKLYTWNLQRSPILVIGQGRSGTTVIQQSLGQCPSILTTPKESPLVGEIGRVIHLTQFNKESDYFKESSNSDLADIEELFHKINLYYGIGNKRGKKSFLKDLVGLKYIFRPKYWMVKAFPTEESFKGLMHLYPDLKAIYIYRNGFDQINSSMKHSSFKGKEFTEYCRLYNHFYEKYHYLEKSENAYCLKHEDLIEDPKFHLSEIYEFLDIDYYPGSLKFLQNNLIHPLDNPSKIKTEKANEIIKNRTPVWSEWTDEQKETFKKTCSKVMLKRGYDIPF